MCAVHDHRGHYLLHVGDISEVYHKVIVAKAVSSFGEPYLGGARIQRLLHGVAHVLSAQKLCLLDVYDFTCLGGRCQQVGLAAEKSRYLYDVHYFAYRLRLPAFVYVGEDSQSVFGLDVIEHGQSLLQPRPSERADGGAVGLVK